MVASGDLEDGSAGWKSLTRVSMLGSGKFHSLKIHEISQYAQLYAQGLVLVSLGPPFCHTRYKKVSSFIQLILTWRQRWDSFTSLVTFSHLQLSDGSDEQGLQSHPFVVCSQVSSQLYRLLLILQPWASFRELSRLKWNGMTQLDSDHSRLLKLQTILSANILMGL